ncbi:MAG: HYR domain-containing protein, partial [Bacteroidetes bacterium]
MIFLSKYQDNLAPEPAKAMVLALILLFSMSFWGTGTTWAQDPSGNYNPFVAQGTISPAPLFPAEYNGTGVVSFKVGNTGSDPLVWDANEPNHDVILVMTLSRGVPNVAPLNATTALTVIGGSFASTFTWTYNVSTNTYQGRQNRTIPGLDQINFTNEGLITIQYKVTQNSPKTGPQNGFNVNLTPPPYANSNSQSDDQVSAYTWTEIRDYGDAPISYGSADHFIDVDNYIYLGSLVDGESANQPSATANGDDINGLDDEDGVTFSTLTQGSTANITLTAVGLGRLNAWIDWNGDGDFLDTDEQIATNITLEDETRVLSVAIPAGAITSAPTFARFRFGPKSTPSSGSALFGEVEDYQVTIFCAPPASPLATLIQPTCAVATGTITVTAPTGTGMTYSIGGNYQSSPIFTAVASGTYIVTAKNSAGCVSSGTSVTINGLPSGLALTSASVTTPIHCNGGTSTVTLIATGGTAPIAYTFNGVTNNTGVFGGVSAGTALAYSITDVNSCGPLTGTINVTQPSVLTFGTPVVANIGCQGSNTGVIVVSASGGTGTIVYTILPNVGTQSPAGTFNGLTAQTYIITATDAFGCVKTISVTVTTNPDVTPPTIICQPNILRSADPGLCQATITIINPTATDNCSLQLTVTGVRSDGLLLSAPYPAGMTTITWTATDGSGNTSASCAQTVTVTSGITANDDTGAVVNGLLGGLSLVNVLSNDLVNCNIADLNNVNLSFVSSTNPNVTLSGTNVEVAPGTPEGTYFLTYQICEKVNPANCDEGIVTVTVILPISASLIDAFADEGSVSGVPGGIAVPNVLANDKIDGNPVIPSHVAIAFISSTDPNVTLNGTSVLVAPNTPVGIYDLVYRICEVLNPTNCDQATVTVTVNPSPTLVITNPAAVCSPAAVDLTSAAVTAGSAAGLTYTYWTNAAATIAYATPTTATAGTYYIKGTVPATGYYNIKPVTVTAYPTAIGGTVSGSNASIIYGSSTGNMTLSGHTGTVVKWQKIAGSGSWADITSTSVTYSETPTSVGIWQYRALVTSGTCSQAFSNAFTITVSPKPITVTAVTASKTYNGTIASASVPTISPALPAGDTPAFIQVYNNKKAGTGKTLVPSGSVNDGNGGHNYAVTYVNVTTGVINPLAIVGSITAEDKEYDGKTNAVILIRSLTGVISGDMLSYVGGTANFDTPAAGTNKTVTATGLYLSGADALNYTVNTTATTTANITGIIANTSVTANPGLVQYSDQVILIATITGGAPLGSGLLAAKSVTFTIGGQVMKDALNNTKIPLVRSGTYLVAILAVPLTEITLAGSMAPGIKPVAVTFNDPDLNFLFRPNPATTTLTITPEDAVTYYTGDLLVPAPAGGTATVGLRATIHDITAEPGGDAFAGDIRNATVSFVNRNTNAVLGTAPVTLLSPADSTTGTALFNWTGVPQGDYVIGIVVNNYYSCDLAVENTVVEVYEATGDYLTGGGYVVPTLSSGKYGADNGKKTNFGFDLNFDDKGTILDGRVNILLRRTVDGVQKLYQIRSTSITAVAVNIDKPSELTGRFIGVASLSDITDPLLPDAVANDLTLNINMTDRGGP